MLTPVLTWLAVTPDTDALQLLKKMQETGSRRLLVTDHGHLLAVVSLKDLMNFIATKLDLEGLGRRPAHSLMD